MPVVISAIFGGFDQLPAPSIQTEDVEWVCFTDRPFMAPEPWQVVVLDDRHPAMKYGHPRMKTVWCKTQPWNLVSERKIIWVDGNSRIISPTFVAEASSYGPFATYKHPDRDCIFDEAKASLEIHPAKYHDQHLPEQVTHYRRQGHPDHWGLYAVGTVVYDVADEDTRFLCDRWLTECERWSYQTQLSLPFISRAWKIPVQTFDHHQIVGNPWMRLDGHLAET